jgi:hypothetical protein
LYVKRNLIKYIMDIQNSKVKFSERDALILYTLLVDQAATLCSSLEQLLTSLASCLHSLQELLTVADIPLDERTDKDVRDTVRLCGSLLEIWEKELTSSIVCGPTVRRKNYLLQIRDIQTCGFFSPFVSFKEANLASNISIRALSRTEPSKLDVVDAWNEYGETAFVSGGILGP